MSYLVDSWSAWPLWFDTDLTIEIGAAAAATPVSYPVSSILSGLYTVVYNISMGAHKIFSRVRKFCGYAMDSEKNHYQIAEDQIFFCVSDNILNSFKQTLVHTYIHPFNGPLSRTTWVSRYQKGKTIWILLQQEAVSGSGISWAKCKSAPHSRQITTPAPHHLVFYRPDALPAAQPTVSKHWRHQTNISNKS